MARVLLVDDDIDFLNMMDQGLRMNRFEVFACQDSMEALRLITEFGFDAILTDLQMPRMNGLQLISYIKASDKNKTTPIYIISGQDLTSLALKELNVVKVMPKPFALGDLVKSLHSVTEQTMTHRRPVAYSPELIQIFRAGCLQTLNFYSKKSIASGVPFIKPNNDRLNTFSGIVCLFGKRLYGSMALGCESNFIEQILTEMFMQEDVKGQNIEALLVETFLEIINQMAGAFKSEMLKKFVTFKIGLPEIIPRELKNYKHKVSGHTICIPLMSGDHQLHLELCLGSLTQEKEIEDQSFELFLTA